MPNNLISSITEFLSPDIVNKIASALGLESEVVQKAIGAAVPSILSGMANVASTPDGARRLAQTVSAQKPGILDSFKSMIGGRMQKDLADSGSNLMSSLLGRSTTDAMGTAIGQFCGIGQDISSKLLGFLGPVVLGVLGKEQRNAGLDASGLARLLSSQKDAIADAMPANFVSYMGDSMSSDAQSTSAGDYGAASIARKMSNRPTMPAGASYLTSTGDGRTSSPNWLLWLLPLLILAGLTWYLTSQPNEQKVVNDARQAADQVVKDVKDAAKEMKDTVHAATDKVQAAAPDAIKGLVAGGVDVGNEFTTALDKLKTSLQGIKDPATAQAALPELQNLTNQFDKLAGNVKQLPAESHSVFANFVSSSMTKINALFDEVLKIPGVGPVAKPAIDGLRSKLNALASKA